MRLLLPPSETKQAGGDAGAPLNLASLSFPALTRERRVALRELRMLSRSHTTMTAALRLGPTQRHEAMGNREVTRSPTMPALDRFTGVLYDALDAGGLTLDQRAFADRVLVVHSALFGLLGGGDAVPVYRLSPDSRLPTVRLRSLWRDAIAREVSELPGVVVDLRSDAYAALGPIPATSDRHVIIRVVADGPTGARPLNHFNKQGKGAFARAVVRSGIDHPTVESLLDWATDNGIHLRASVPGSVDLVVDAHRAPSTPDQPARQHPLR